MPRSREAAVEQSDHDPKRKRRTLAAGLAAVVVLSVTACVLLGPSDGELGNIRAALKQGALVVDVRSPGEFADGHLRGAVNVPVGELEARLGELGAKGAPLVVY
jgi:3-mercaptopyruvate sulfurtransferase SseA